MVYSSLNVSPVLTLAGAWTTILCAAMVWQLEQTLCVVLAHLSGRLSLRLLVGGLPLLLLRLLLLLCLLFIVILAVVLVLSLLLLLLLLRMFLVVLLLSLLLLLLEFLLRLFHVVLGMLVVGVVFQRLLVGVSGLVVLVLVLVVVAYIVPVAGIVLSTSAVVLVLLVFAILVLVLLLLVLVLVASATATILVLVLLLLLLLLLLVFLQQFPAECQVVTRHVVGRIAAERVLVSLDGLGVFVVGLQDDPDVVPRHGLSHGVVLHVGSTLVLAEGTVVLGGRHHARHVVGRLAVLGILGNGLSVFDIGLVEL